MEGLVLLYVLLAIGVGAVASARGRIFVGWFLVALLLTPLFALLMVGFMPARPTVVPGPPHRGPPPPPLSTKPAAAPWPPQPPTVVPDAPAPRHQGLVLALGSVAVVMLVVVASLAISQPSLPPSSSFGGQNPTPQAQPIAGPAARPAPPTRVVPPEPHLAVTIASLRVTRAGFGAVLIVDATLSNGNDYAVKDVVLSCDVFGRSGTRIQVRSTTIFDSIAANGRKRFRELNLGFLHEQASNVDCVTTRALRL